MLDIVEIRLLRYFVTVVECGSLTAAAAQLHLSQPPLSVAMTQLEREFGVRLLVRSPRGVEPTSAGRYLLEAASRILGDVEDTVDTLTRFGAGRAGSLRVAAVPTLMWHRMPTVLRGFAAERPEVDLHLSDPPPWTAIDMLEQRRVDMAAIMVADGKRFAQRHGDMFDVYDWGPVPLVAVLPPGDAIGDVCPLDLFAERTMVLPRRTAAVPSLPEAVDDALQIRGIRPRVLRATETIQTSIPLIEAGVACGILPDPDRRSLARFNIAVRPLDPEPAPLRALILTRRGSGQNPLLATIIAHLHVTASIMHDNT
jgi:DNA-binding transcriptional LysR family regulator